MWAGAIVALMIATVLLAHPSAESPSPTSGGPYGTLALRRFIASRGQSVSDAEEPLPPPSTFVLLADFRDKQADDRLVGWVEGGGTLVVADPESLLTDAFGVSVAGRVGGFTNRVIPAGCASADSTGVRQIEVASDDEMLTGPPAGVACFVAGSGSFAVEVHRGRGRAILLGGHSLFTNRYLARQDNAAYVARILGTGPVRFAPAEEESGAARPHAGLWSSMPAGARAVVLQVVLAVLLFAAVRARRLGRPTPEVAISPIPAGELVTATGRLLRSARATPYAARTVRAFTERRLGGRMSAADVAELHAITSDPPKGDADLIAVAARLDMVRKRIEEEDA